MLNRFLHHIRAHRLLRDKQRTLLAVSGGLDSVTMVELFRQANLPFALAHANFQLRGSASGQDEAFVRQLAETLKAKVFVRRFNTREHADQHGVSIQMAARELRYRWMEEVREANGFDAMATAHHLDDSIETLLINLLRGCGLPGLKGIPVRTKQVIRPLLFARRGEIEHFAREQALQYREDLSNEDSTYLRNKVRHKLIPILKEISPGLHEQMQAFFDRMAGTEAIYRMMIDQQREDCVEQKGQELHILKSPLAALPYPGVFLYEFLKGFGFSASVCAGMLADMDRQPGKRYHSGTHTALRDRDAFIVFESRPDAEGVFEEVLPSAEAVRAGHFVFLFETRRVDKAPPLPDGPNTLVADADRLNYPLVLRSWKPGDTLVPLGMKGRKKVSDLLTGEKIPLHRKREVIVLTSGDEIVWVAGVRASDPFKVTGTTKNFLVCSMTSSTAGGPPG